MDHIGIDVNKRESQICILAEGGELIECRIRTEPERFAAVLDNLSIHTTPEVRARLAAQQGVCASSSSPCTPPGSIRDLVQYSGAPGADACQRRAVSRTRGAYPLPVTGTALPAPSAGPSRATP
jgi:hypothetical protein